MQTRPLPRHTGCWFYLMRLAKPGRMNQCNAKAHIRMITKKLQNPACLVSRQIASNDMNLLPAARIVRIAVTPPECKSAQFAIGEHINHSRASRVPGSKISQTDGSLEFLLDRGFERNVSHSGNLDHTTIYSPSQNQGPVLLQISEFVDARTSGALSYYAAAA